MSAVEQASSWPSVAVHRPALALTLGSQTRPWRAGGRFALLLDLLKLLCVLG